MDAPEGQHQTSRRKLLQGGLAATGASYVAPQVLRTSVAGAQTSTTYAFEFIGNDDAGRICGVDFVGFFGAAGLLSAAGHSACDANFNTAFSAALPNEARVECPPPSCLSDLETASIGTGGLGGGLGGTVTATISSSSTSTQILWFGVRTRLDPSPEGCFGLNSTGNGSVNVALQAGEGTAGPLPSVASFIVIVECVGSP